MRSGWVSLDFSALRHLGSHAYNWLPLARPDSADAYFLYVDDQIVYPAIQDNRFDACPVLITLLLSAKTSSDGESKVFAIVKT